MSRFYKISITFAIVAMTFISTAHARGVGDIGSDLGDFGDLVKAPRCEFVDKEAAKCNCITKEDGKCVEFAICECTDTTDANCACVNENEEPRKLTKNEVDELIRDKLVKLIKGRKIGSIDIDDEKASVQINELSGAPFYTVIIDREKGRERRHGFEGDYQFDRRSKIGKTKGQR